MLWGIKIKTNRLDTENHTCQGVVLDYGILLPFAHVKLVECYVNTLHNMKNCIALQFEGGACGGV